jgi:hypothetical protein
MLLAFQNRIPFFRTSLVKQFARNALATAVVVMSANAVQAAPVKLDWTTTVSYSGISGLSAGDAVTMTFEFNVAGGNLNSARLNATNFVSYSFTLFDGRSATFDLVGAGSRFPAYGSNNFFVFDALGHLQQVQQFYISDASISSNVAAWNGASAVIFNNGANCFSCSSPVRFDVNNVGAGLLTGSWTVEAGNTVPEPVSLALVGVGLLACGVARRRRAAA